MAKGRPTKWATATIMEPVSLGKGGIAVVVWEKYRKKRKGKVVISVGGIRWYPYKAKRPYQKGWSKFAEMMES